MSENKKNSDIFLQSIGKVRPIKKSGKKLKKLKIFHIRENDKNKNTVKFKILPATNKKETIIDNTIFQTRSSLTDKKLKKGKIKIDRKIDLHGLSLVEAKRIFINTIEESFYSNYRCILFVTGKGIKKNIEDSSNPRLFYGKIRENFQKWIFEKGISSKILNVTPAGAFHGGDGAFFVYLRKNKIKF